ncbi:bifunctional (p)ppGpp synthetase/guanosine-3',5'-bis(diphosphate) 3'-pyrophosphohydrolase [Sporosarcina sp. Marseille-Q4063]|uniref:HD domain-containing protein n=1 Tax=Sporosarcina sp. Marseille-Q4063 TaxID=2810514 RepID=UPI001BAF88ED|nr:HD domain-containing protein [Sporosarcina sp. Marseille-Q4063]QUW23011.1 bifunctional (p)ppGpp synthetase/guanosine-3',5'-bis(diphosphate) 3'-pyrophosphohydrolase [Sporosarcina sp. Marseille-Q4063]
MNIIEKAINFAAIAHAGQMRKGTNTPYITHPFAVGMCLQKLQCTDEVVAAGILHDTLEDTPVTFEELAEHFGPRVAELVLAASEEDKSLAWFERKQQMIDQLSRAGLEEIQVITADKLHNIKSIRADIESYGDDVWNRFNRGKVDQHWYYSSIVKTLLPRKSEFGLIGELEREVLEVFGEI